MGRRIKDNGKAGLFKKRKQKGSPKKTRPKMSQALYEEMCELEDDTYTFESLAQEIEALLEGPPVFTRKPGKKIKKIKKKP